MQSRGNVLQYPFIPHHATQEDGDEGASVKMNFLVTTEKMGEGSTHW